MADPTPGVVLDRPDRAGRVARFAAHESEAKDDPHAVAEREAIRAVEAEDEEQHRRWRATGDVPQECVAWPMSRVERLAFDHRMLRRAKLEYMRAIVRRADAREGCRAAMDRLGLVRRRHDEAINRYRAAKAERFPAAEVAVLRHVALERRGDVGRAETGVRERRALLLDAIDRLDWQREAYIRAKLDFEARHEEITLHVA